MKKKKIENYPSKEFVYNKLKELGNTLLKGAYKNKWTEDNPTLGYCYIVSEAVYHFCGNEEDDIKACCINLGSDYGVHWYLEVNGEKIDYTADQFEFDVPYELGKGKGFFKGGIETERGFISKRGYEIAKILDLI